MVLGFLCNFLTVWWHGVEWERQCCHRSQLFEFEILKTGKKIATLDLIEVTSSLIMKYYSALAFSIDKDFKRSFEWASKHHSCLFYL